MIAYYTLLIHVRSYQKIRNQAEKHSIRETYITHTHIHVYIPLEEHITHTHIHAYMR